MVKFFRIFGLGICFILIHLAFKPLSTEAQVPKLKETDLRIYKDLLNPEDYPEYNKRPLPIPTRSTLGDRLQFAISGIPFKRLSDQYSAYGGKTYRIEETGLAKEDPEYQFYKVFADSTFNLRIAGFKPLRKPGDQNHHGLFNNATGYSERVQMIYDWLGPNYLGMHFGESDASYFNMGEQYTFPLSRSKELQGKAFRNYFEYYGTQTNNYVLLHLNMGGAHHLMKEGIVSLAEAQTFYRGETNPLIHYSFIRGAGKQYGVLSAMGHSAGTVNANTGQEAPFSLYRRLVYLNYLYNGVDQTQEFGIQQRDWDPSQELVPRGKMISHMAKYIDQNPNPGAMVTPVALFMDFNAGWRTPDKRRTTFDAWMNLPYTQGDYLTDGIFSMLYPGFERIGLYKNFRYDLTDAPYGDMTDVILSDVREDILERYHLAIVSSKIENDFKYIRAKLEGFANKGGNVLITGANAQKLWPEWNIGKATTIKSGSKVKVLGADDITESESFELHQIGSLPTGAELLMQLESNDPVAFEVQKGSGVITVLLTPYGINKNEKSFNWNHNSDEKDPQPMSRPFGLLKHAEALYDAKLKMAMPFTVGEGLNHVVNVVSDTEYHVTIFNNSLTQKAFSISSNIGEIVSTEEIDMGERGIMDDPEYLPYVASQYNVGTSDASNIQGHDVRMFKVTIDPKNVNTLENIEVKDNGLNRFIAEKDFHNLKMKLKSWDAFTNEFSGVKLDGNDLLNASEEIVDKDSKYFNTRAYGFVFDFRDLEAEQLSDAFALANNFDHAHIISNDFPEKVEEILNNTSINTYVTAGEIDKFVFINENEDLSKDLTDKIVVINRVYENWDDVYTDAQIVWNDEEGKLSPIPEDSKSSLIGTTKSENSLKYLSLRNLSDIPNRISQVPSFMEHFGGIMLESDYIYGISDTKALEEKSWLDSKKIDMIVDFSSAVDGFSKMVLDKSWDKKYDRGMEYAEAVLKRMNLMQLDKVVITAHRLGQGENEGLTDFATLAKDQNIDVYIRDTEDVSSKINDIVTLLNNQGLQNVHVSSSYGLAKNNETIKKNTSMIFLCQISGSKLLPLALNNMVNISEFEQANKMLILDAEYLTSAEMVEDMTEFGWDVNPRLFMKEEADYQFTLSTDFDGAEKYEWYKDNTKLSVTTSTLTASQIEDFGVYSCAISIGNSKFKTQDLTVDQITAVVPSIKIRSHEGEFEIQVQPDDAPTYTWYKDDIVLEGHHSSTLSGSHYTDYGRYYATFDYNEEFFQTPVVEAEQIDPNAPPLSTNIDKETLVFTISTIEDAQSYQWFKNDEKLMNQTSFTFKGSQYTDYGKYHCIVTIEDKAYRTYSVSIEQSLPELELDLQSPEFTITINASGPYAYQWYKNDKSISESTDQQISGNQYDNYGIYHCELIYNNKRAKSNAIEIAKEDKVTHLDKIKSQCRIVPNPAKNQFRIETENYSKGTWHLFALNGKMIKSGIINNQSVSVIINELSSGIYIVSLNFDNHSENHRLVIK
ncbi:T9SS type A sorting domain-containing protein [Aureibacter tunicatorum]|uniref:Ig-like domain-containing protein n=1 Tax=Aureibacter tunicatorum TaxID=866807 RepID=A0AAE4BUF5_9BACT|nr:T9SS type A sorting domain-containing protein [Aureibacter tunicatorum]MDR6241736.1 hypothetical protein [Aureibacter tunicatorum]BDD07402.1 hypothetical protein AUTU_48850 [Aureibacter tunicatorum]